MLRFIRGTIFNRSGPSFTNLVRLHSRLKNTHCVDSWIVATSSTGFVEVKTHFTTYIKPMHPLEIIESDILKLFEDGYSTKACARVTLNMALQEDSNVVVNDEFFDEFSKDIRYNPQLNIIKREHHLVVKGRPQRKFSFPPEDISITIEVPVQFNLNVNAADDANVHINDLEGGWIYDISIDKGNCYISSVKGTDLHIKSNNGNIISESTLMAEFGTLAVRNTGIISVQKLQGRKFCLDSELGSISAGPMYLQRGEVTSQSGGVNLGDIHGKTEIKARDDINIMSVSGDLHAETNKGNISLHLSQFTNIDLKSRQGDIHATIEKSQQLTTVKAKAKQITFSPDIDVFKRSEDTGETFTSLAATINPSNKPSSSSGILKVETKQGSFKMEYKDWFTSLKLGLNKQT